MIFARLLARTLGRTFDELCQTMSAVEFQDHWEDYRLSPWGPMRELIHTAMQVQAVSNMAGKVRPEGKELGLEDAVMGLRYHLAKILEPEKYKEPEPDPATFFGQHK